MRGRSWRVLKNIIATLYAEYTRVFSGTKVTSSDLAVAHSVKRREDRYY